jgi:hypothetical protein
MPKTQLFLFKLFGVRSFKTHSDTVAMLRLECRQVLRDFHFSPRPTILTGDFCEREFTVAAVLIHKGTERSTYL